MIITTTFAHVDVPRWTAPSPPLGGLHRPQRAGRGGARRGGAWRGAAGRGRPRAGAAGVTGPDATRRRGGAGTHRGPRRRARDSRARRRRPRRWTGRGAAFGGARRGSGGWGGGAGFGSCCVAPALRTFCPQTCPLPFLLKCFGDGQSHPLPLWFAAGLVERMGGADGGGGGCPPACRNFHLIFDVSTPLRVLGDVGTRARGGRSPHEKLQLQLLLFLSQGHSSNPPHVSSSSRRDRRGPSCLTPWRLGKPDLGLLALGRRCARPRPGLGDFRGEANVRVRPRRTPCTGPQ